MSYKSELEKCCDAMSQFARDRLLAYARAFVKTFPGEDRIPMLTLVENVGQAEVGSRSLDSNVKHIPVSLVRKTVDRQK